MIIDRLENLRHYAPLLCGLEKGLSAIQEQGEDAPLGRYDFDGGYFLVQEGETTPMEEGKFEAHKRFVDVQIILKGSEEVGWNDISTLEVAIPYDETKDAGFYQGSFEHVMKISGGMFYVAFPWDGHRACGHTKKVQSYRKIVLKLPYQG